MLLWLFFYHCYYAVPHVCIQTCHIVVSVFFFFFLHLAQQLFEWPKDSHWVQKLTCFVQANQTHFNSFVLLCCVSSILRMIALPIGWHTRVYLQIGMWSNQLQVQTTYKAEPRSWLSANVIVLNIFCTMSATLA